MKQFKYLEMTTSEVRLRFECRQAAMCMCRGQDVTLVMPDEINGKTIGDEVNRLSEEMRRGKRKHGLCYIVYDERQKVTGKTEEQ